MKMNTARPIMALPFLVALVLQTGCGSGTETTDATTRTGSASASGAPRAESATASPAATRSSVDLCGPHGVPAALCLACDPALRDPQRLWCKGHGRYEDRCWACHPELQDPDRLYCDEHGFYEDECMICHPETAASPSPASQAATGLEGLQCKEHGVPEAVCGTCHPELADGLEPGQGLRVRMPSMDSVRKAGVVARPVTPASASSRVEAVGRVDYDRNHLFRVTAPSSGIVREVRLDLGDAVRAGDVLVVISSPEIAEVKALLLQALAEKAAAAAEFTREQELHEAGVSPEQDVIEAGARARRADAAVRAASQRLVGLGMTPGEAREAERAESADATLPLRAPFGGTVVSRTAVVGDVVEPGRELLQVADLETLWVEVSLPRTLAASVRPGLPVTIAHRDGGSEHSGVITWIADRVHPETGMVEARAEIANPDRDLRAGTFVRVLLPEGTNPEATLVPSDAVHRFGGHPFVFVEREEDLFDVRRVDARPVGADVMALVAGIGPEDRIVLEGSFLIKSEFQKARLGAGCAH